MDISVLPSLLAADFGNLRAGARLAEESGADWLHLDIMDGHLVPNLSFGPAVVKMSKQAVSIPLSVHLMLTRPDQYVVRFIDAGADSLLIHVEAECDVPQTLDHIRELGVRTGITLNPETPAQMVFPVLDKVDEVLCMTVHPGYGGQAFISDVLPKVRAIRDYATGREIHDLSIMVDGGIDPKTAAICASHGADAFVAGTSLYGAGDMAAEIALLRKRAAESLVL